MTVGDMCAARSVFTTNLMETVLEEIQLASPKPPNLFQNIVVEHD
jgi:hypothetical protein